MVRIPPELNGNNLHTIPKAKQSKSRIILLFAQILLYSCATHFPPSPTDFPNNILIVKYA